jgi:thiol-disulfide isomerase/thioredoxin
MPIAFRPRTEFGKGTVIPILSIPVFDSIGFRTRRTASKSIEAISTSTTLHDNIIMMTLRNVAALVISSLLMPIQILTTGFVPGPSPCRSRRPYDESRTPTAAVTSTTEASADQARRRTSTNGGPTAFLRADSKEQQSHRPTNTVTTTTTVATIPAPHGTTTKTGGFLPHAFDRRPLVTQVTTIHDYKRHVVDHPHHALVCVRFYAPWCRACQAMAPRFRQLAAVHYDSVTFVECPLTRDNAFLHQGLGVPSLPYAHLYHRDVGLVEERNINRKVFGEFGAVLQTYVDGSCPVTWEEEEDDDEKL